MLNSLFSFISKLPLRLGHVMLGFLKNLAKLDGDEYVIPVLAQMVVLIAGRAGNPEREFGRFKETRVSIK